MDAAKTPTASAYARTLTESETNVIISNAEDFLAYANAIRSNSTPSSGGLPAEMDGETANGLIENCFNYHYARINQEFANYENGAIDINLAENASGNVALLDVAAGFNTALDDVKADYAALGDKSDKQLVSVDVSWIDGGSFKRLTVTYTFGWEQQSQLPKNVVFDANEAWNWRSKGGNAQGQFIGTSGAPEVLRGKIRANIGYLIYGSGMPVNIIQENNQTAQNPDFTTSTYNAWGASINLDIAQGVRFFAANTGPLPNGLNITADGLNFYRTELRDMIIARSAALNKTFLNIFIIGNQQLFGPPAGYAAGHAVYVQYCDLAPFTLPTATPL